MDVCNEFSCDSFSLHISLRAHRLALPLAEYLPWALGVHRRRYMDNIWRAPGTLRIGSAALSQPSVGWVVGSDVTAGWGRSLVSHRGSCKLLLHGWCQDVTTQSGWEDDDLGRLGPSVLRSWVSPLGVDGKEVGEGEKSWRRSPSETCYPRTFNSNRKPLTWRQMPWKDIHREIFYLNFYLKWFTGLNQQGQDENPHLRQEVVMMLEWGKAKRLQAGSQHTSSEGGFCQHKIWEVRHIITVKKRIIFHAFHSVAKKN